MIKGYKFIVSEEEKNRILNLHEESSKNQYLVIEQLSNVKKTQDKREPITTVSDNKSSQTQTPDDSIYDAWSQESEFVPNKINNTTKEQPQVSSDVKNGEDKEKPKENFEDVFKGLEITKSKDEDTYIIDLEKGNYVYTYKTDEGKIHAKFLNKQGDSLTNYPEKDFGTIGELKKYLEDNKLNVLPKKNDQTSDSQQISNSNVSKPNVTQSTVTNSPTTDSKGFQPDEVKLDNDKFYDYGKKGDKYYSRIKPNSPRGNLDSKYQQILSKNKNNTDWVEVKPGSPYLEKIKGMTMKPSK